MLLQPRSYQLWQTDNRDSDKCPSDAFSFFQQTRRFDEERHHRAIACKMLLVHQSGSVKVGEVVRYTLTYRPSDDRILPTPQHLHVKVKNTSAIPLRAAWVHGPYTLHVSAYSSNFNPHVKVEDPKHDGLPEYEPMLKAGGSWTTKLLVPDDIRETGADLGKKRQSMHSNNTEDDGKGTVTWIIEVASQILFSTSAAVNFEVLVGRDERSLDLGFAAVAGHGHGGPGRVQYHATERERKRARKAGHVQTAGVYSKAVRLQVEDTEILWDKPPLPSHDDYDKKAERPDDAERGEQPESSRPKKARKRKNVHLVIITHGLHSNLGADMLFLKESIDATVKRAREEKQKRKEERRKQQAQSRTESKSAQAADSKLDADQDGKDPTSTAPLSGGQEDLETPPDDSDDDEEETVVRGFPGNAVKTENGIQYLGKRLAKYILRFTYPDQPFLPVKKNLTRTLTDTFKSEANKAKRDGMPSHTGSTIHNPAAAESAEELPYKFTSISFVGHSLGGLIQTYAVAYIHKHSPTFFSQIKPVNFICLASPMLGLSNENPMYVKFALDFGLVGRTGQDLGLTWRAPTIAKGGWNAVFGGQGAAQKGQDQEHGDPTSKPLLRILPTGPAHQVLRMFRNRTVYSNVVNDGIVPLRTSCLLFLDWRGLGKVDKARRENGLIGTVAEWGWNEITGQNSTALTSRVPAAERAVRGDDDEENEHVRKGEGETVPQPGQDETADDARTLTTRPSYDETSAPPKLTSETSSTTGQSTQHQEKGVWDNFLDFFRASPAPEQQQQAPVQRSAKTKRAFLRGQTVDRGDDELPDDIARGREGTTTNPTMRPHLPHGHAGSKQQQKRPGATRGESMIDESTGELVAPPKTSIFESAGDILHPPLPSNEWITDPSSRSRTIFHDRVYHPEDIPPPPPTRRQTTYGFSGSKTSLPSAQSSQSSTMSATSQDTSDTGGMKVEEKIARAYHRDLSWRKVLVRMEPDAHNNIIVRRMFANAYGWPVIKHLCDTHFADTHAAATRDEQEPARERAPPMEKAVSQSGEEVKEQTARQVHPRTDSETREARDELTALDRSHDGASSTYSSTTSRGGKALSRMSSAQWDDSYFEGTDDDDSDVDERNLVSRIINPNVALKKPEQSYQPSSPKEMQRNGAPRTPTSPYTDGHRGLAPISPTLSSKSKSPGSATKTAASTKSTFNAADVEPETPIVANKLVSEPEALGAGSTAEMGLRKSVEEQVAGGSPSSKKRPRSEGADSAAGRAEGVETRDKAKE